MQPRCRYCAKPIRKKTTTHWFGRPSTNLKSFIKTHIEKPKTREEAQRLINEKIVSVGYWTDAVHPEIGRYIDKVSTWDGESYVDQFFCSNLCAQKLGYLMAKKGNATKLYWESTEKVREAS